MSYISPSRRGACSGCGKTVQVGPKSAAQPRCRECRALRAAHGSARAYKAGCRCDRCKKYNRDRMRLYAARRSAEGRPLCRSGPEHDCAGCGTKFRARRSTAANRYCSLDCAVRAQGGELGSGKARDRPRKWMSDSERDAFFEAAGWCCALCGDQMRPDVGYLHDLYPTIDHIVPRSRGGGDDISNLQPAHRICNLRKGAKDVETFRLELAS